MNEVTLPVVCGACGRFLHTYRGPQPYQGMTVFSVDFHPAEGVPRPQVGHRMECPFCGRRLLYPRLSPDGKTVTMVEMPERWDVSLREAVLTRRLVALGLITGMGVFVLAKALGR